MAKPIVLRIRLNGNSRFVRATVSQAIKIFLVVGGLFSFVAFIIARLVGKSGETLGGAWGLEVAVHHYFIFGAIVGGLSAGPILYRLVAPGTNRQSGGSSGLPPARPWPGRAPAGGDFCGGESE